MLNRRRLVLGLAAIGGTGAAYLAFGLRRTSAESDQALTPQEALAAVDAGEILLVDIRRPDEWAKTGIARGATPIDMRRPDFIAAVLDARETPDQPVALICARGVRSYRMSQRLATAGLSPILDVPEGMLGGKAGPGWLAADLPVLPWSG